MMFSRIGKEMADESPWKDNVYYSPVMPAESRKRLWGQVVLPIDGGSLMLKCKLRL